MATVTQLVDCLADNLGLERSIVAGYARELREAGLIPTGKQGRHAAHTAHVDPEHAVNLLIALMASDCRTKAPEAVDVFAKIPMILGVRTREVDGSVVSERFRAEDIPVVPGTGEDMLVAMRSFGGALADLVASFATGRVMPGAPQKLATNRDIAAPSAAIEAPIIATHFEGRPVGRREFSATYLYGRSGDADALYAPRAQRLQVLASVPGAVLHVLGNLLRDGAPIYEPKQQEAVNDMAQENYLAGGIG